jgi:DNA-directed RNA polymerase subunit RPC12/RpoP
VPFTCPGCSAEIDERPDRPFLRCPACSARLRCRPTDAGGANPTFELEVAGRPETRRRVELRWDEAERRRLSRWLVVSSTITVALVVLLFLLARLLR